MKTLRPLLTLMLYGAGASIVAGIVSFVVLGGVPKLAGDIGFGGVWIVLPLLNVIYAALFSSGLAVAYMISTRVDRLSLSKSSVIVASAGLAVVVTAQGSVNAGPPGPFSVFAAQLFAMSVAGHLVVAVVFSLLHWPNYSPKRALRD